MYKLTDYGWEVKEHEHVKPAISREPPASSKLMEVIAAKRRTKSVVKGVAMDPMECRVLGTVSAKEACLL